LFVDAGATGANDGRSWARAFRDLQSALAIAVQGDQIWVAQGGYYPVAPGGRRDVSFNIRSGVALYGGFDGSETQLAQRDFRTHVTILSGDINRDDVYVPAYDITTWNSNHVVTMWQVNGQTRLDGFRVEAGNHQGGSFGHKLGAGIFMDGSPTVANCIFTRCIADEGGAIYAGGSPLIVDCQFIGNGVEDDNALGGALYVVSTGAIIRHCAFIDNWAEGWFHNTKGGAIYVHSGPMLIDDCWFRSNRAQGIGDHTSSYGGAIFVRGGNCLVNRSRFLANSAASGGAIASTQLPEESFELSNSIIMGSRAFGYGSGQGFPYTGSGGALFLQGSLTARVSGCLITHCTAADVGGAYMGIRGDVASSILWENSDANGSTGLSQVRGGAIRYSCVMNMLVGIPGEPVPNPADFPGCIDQDPMLDPSTLELLGGSPCIDAADNSAWGLGHYTDLAGRPRFVDDPQVPDTGMGSAPIADMGPFERQ
jgi:hypothetical protein